MTSLEILVIVIIGVALIEISPAIFAALLFIMGFIIVALFSLAEILQWALHRVIYWMFGIDK
jgi:hypothetical protein